MAVLDHAYHTKVYQSVTEVGPFKIPKGIEVPVEKAIELAKSAASVGTQVLGHFTGQGSEAVAFSTRIENFHVPTQRNWTRAINGTLQGIVFAIMALFLKKNLKLPFLLISVSWSAVGVRHLTSVAYTRELHQYYRRNTKMFWQ